MKHLLALPLFFACGLPAMAQDELCAVIGSIAESIMVERQADTPLSSMMATLRVQPGIYTRMMRAMIMDAYGEPGAATERSQVRAVAEFRNKWELECYKTLEPAN